jgi:hypothetical protein
MLHIIYSKLLNSDPDPKKIFWIRQNYADPTLIRIRIRNTDI